MIKARPAISSKQELTLCAPNSVTAAPTPSALLLYCYLLSFSLSLSLCFAAQETRLRMRATIRDFFCYFSGFCFDFWLPFERLFYCCCSHLPLASIVAAAATVVVIRFYLRWQVPLDKLLVICWLFILISIRRATIEDQIDYCDSVAFSSFSANQRAWSEKEIAREHFFDVIIKMQQIYYC